MTNDTSESSGQPPPDARHPDQRMRLQQWSPARPLDSSLGCASSDCVDEDLRGQSRVLAAEEQVAHLQTALQTNRRIGIAIGILMGIGKIGEAEAFELLRQASSRRNVKLRLVAEDVIRTGTLE